MFPLHRLQRPGAAAIVLGRPFLAVVVNRLFLALVIGLALAWPPAVGAQGAPPRVRDAVTDLAEVLTDAEQAEVVRALEEVRDDTGLQLFVLYTDTTGDDPAPDFAAAVAEASSLGGDDALLLVAFEDRTYAIWVGGALEEITDREIDRVLADEVEPRLRVDDPAGAAIQAARALGQASGPPVPTAAPTATPSATPGGGSTPGGRGGIDLTPVLAIAVVVVGIVIVGRVVVARRAELAATAEERDRLAREANRALLEGDELLRDAEEELGFAEAQWGEAETRQLREALATAKSEVQASFAVRQRLDDAEPETPAQREAMVREILSRMATATSTLDAQLERIEALRDLERTAPEQLAALPAAIRALADRHAAASTLLARLEEDYLPSALGPVAGNLVEAEKALATARAETEHGTSTATTDRSAAVVALRRAQEALASAAALLDAVERLGAGLDEAATRITPELTEAEADIARARSLVEAEAESGASTVDHAARLADAERLLATARASAGADRVDPLAVLEDATTAHRAADAVLAGAQESARARQRQAAILESSIASARGRVDRAIGYITTRRHGVGERARTRAAEAEARLRDAESLATTDPEAALRAAQRAIQLADEAYALASREFGAWDDRRGPVAGPYRPVPGGGGDVMGAVLGGIIGGILAGGMRGGRGSGWGGSTWGGGSRRSGGGFGMPRPPMGGGGRSRGGSFGGGGGRARGGRW